MPFTTCCHIVLLLLLGIQSAAVNSMQARIVGEAFDLESGELLYTETHCVSDDTLTREVIYKNVEQQLLAHKLLTYKDGPLIPSFVQQNFYSGEEVAVDFNDNQLTMIVKNAGSSAPQETILTISKSSVPLVIDAGFDAFVRQHWAGLVDGQTKQFQFPFAARKSVIALRITAAPCSYSGDTDQCFRLEIDNWLFSMLVAPIELGYDSTLKHLSRFRGLSNIGDGSGGGLSVDIRYRYQDVPDVCTINDPILATSVVR